MMSVKIDVFGAARALSDQGMLSVDVPEGATVADVLAVVLERPEARRPGLAEVLKLAVLATSEDILPPNTPVPSGVRLALLPPVAGG